MVRPLSPYDGQTSTAVSSRQIRNWAGDMRARGDIASPTNKVIGERCRHLQRVIGIRPNQRRLEFPELHSVLDAVAGMAVLLQRHCRDEALNWLADSAGA
jgi:hypothetical protein